MASYSREEAADRAGVSVGLLSRIVELEILGGHSGDGFSESDIRKIGLIGDFVEGGLPLDALALLAAELKSGRLTLSFMDSPDFDLFATLSSQTFEQLSASTGIPIQTLAVMREAVGSSIPDPTDLVRENEMSLVPYIQGQLASGYPTDAIERALRTMGEGLRRFAIGETERFGAFVIGPQERHTAARAGYAPWSQQRTAGEVSAKSLPTARSDDPIVPKVRDALKLLAKEGWVVLRTLGSKQATRSPDSTWIGHRGWPSCFGSQARNVEQYPPAGRD